MLERYGVLFYDIMLRETAAPAWSELRPVLRRLEAQGRIRGGRFILGTSGRSSAASNGETGARSVSGEQFALPGVIERLRAAREYRQGSADNRPCVVLSPADPLNLVGVLLPGERIAGGRNARLVFQDGRHVATRDGEHTEFHGELSSADIDNICATLDAPRTSMVVP